MNRTPFFAHVRTNLTGGTLKQSQVEAMDAILDEAERRGTPVGHLAYILATAFHEAGADMAPKRENLFYTKASRIRAVWPSRFRTDAAAAPFVRNPRGLANEFYNGRMGKRPGSDDGWQYSGRGWVQLTGRDNYARASKALGLDLLSNPGLALEEHNAIAILFEGIEGGWFTKVSLSDVDDTPSYIEDRKVINGTDRAALVADYAVIFEKALRAGAYRASAPAERAQEPAPAAPVAPALTDRETTAVAALAAWMGRRPAGAAALLAWLNDMPEEAIR